MFILWGNFFLCAFLIIISGYKLSETAGRIVSAGRLSEGLMGVLILAAITSFPEMWTSVASVVKINAPNLGIGNLIGSVMFNLIIIAALDYRYGKAPILSSAKRYHLITCAFSLVLLGIVLAALSLKNLGGASIGLFGIGLESYLIFSIYLLGLSCINKFSAKEDAPRKKAGQGLINMYILLSICAAVIIGCGFWLASIGKSIVTTYGLNEMYFGTIVIGFTTSLPEIIVSIACLSIGSADMAVANILGSNLFNIAVIPLADLLYRRGYILSSVSSLHIYSSVLVIILTMVIFGSILYKPKKSFMRLGAGSITLILIFLLGNLILYHIING